MCGSHGGHHGHPEAGSQRCTVSLRSVTSERLLGGRCARCQAWESIQSFLLSFPALKSSQEAVLPRHPETQPLPAPLPAVVAPEQLRDGGSGGPILVTCVRPREGEGRVPWAAGGREGMEPEAGDDRPAFHSLHSGSGELKLRKRKPTLSVSAQETRSRRRGECRVRGRALGSRHLRWK